MHLCKVINPEYLDSYFSPSRYSDRTSGAMAELSDVQDLITYSDIYNGLRLDYEGTPFIKPGIDENAVMYAIRFTSDETEDKIVKSVRDTILDNAEWAYPYTGTGFISSADILDLTKVPGTPTKEGNLLIPEYFVLGKGSDAAMLNNGAEMYKITEQGDEILYAIYNETKGVFTKIGE